MAGTIQDIEIIKDKEGKSRGFGTITYSQVLLTVNIRVGKHSVVSVTGFRIWFTEVYCFFSFSDRGFLLSKPVFQS